MSTKEKPQPGTKEKPQPGTKENPLKQITENPYDKESLGEVFFDGVDVKTGYVPLSAPKNKEGKCPNEGFYWLYPSSNPDAPVLVTVIGGPGMCCISKAFGRFNPLDIDRKNKKLVKAPNAITDRFSLLYLESPVGSGFSIATKQTMVPSYQVLGENAIEVFRAVMEVHVPLKTCKWFFNGESFCGLQLPTIAAHFIDAFPGQYKGAVIECCVLGPAQTNDYQNQQDLLDEYKIWNGGCHRCCCHYCLCYGRTCLKMGCIGFETFENYWFLPLALWPCGKMTRGDTEWDEDCEQYVKKNKFKYAPTNLNLHDGCDDTFSCRPDICWLIKSKAFGKAIGSKKAITDVADEEFVNIMSKDLGYTSVPCLEKMLAVQDSTMLIQTGAGDLIVPTNGVQAYIGELSEAKKEGLKESTWTREEDHEWKKSGRLEIRKCYGVGHLIFVDNQELHEKMIVNYLDNAM